MPFQLLKTFPNAAKYLKSKSAFFFSGSMKFLMLMAIVSCSLSTAVVSFGEVTPQQKEEIEKFGVSLYSWDEFLQVVRVLFSTFIFLFRFL